MGAAAVTVAQAGSGAGLPGRLPALPTLPQISQRCPIPSRYRQAFVSAARQTDLPLAMLVAVGQVESNFAANARSSANARGLLQVLPSTGASLRLDVSRPETNVLAGARYLRHLLDEFQSPDLALAAYNAGPTAVARAGGSPTAETAEYVTNVDAVWRSQRGCR